VRRTLPWFLFLTACSTLPAIPSAWTSTPAATRIPSVILDEKGNVIRALPPLASGPVTVEGNRLVRGGKAITDAFVAIDSFDYSESRDEVIFSARREQGFDIGLAAGDGSKTNWVPADPADEVQAQWAPRGNKVSYIVRARHGDVVRTLHIPTSFQYANDFGPATIHDVAWDPAGDKYAVAYSTIDASDRVEVLRYDGRDRVLAIPPAEKVAADVVAFVPGAYALRPHDLAYGEKVPVVVWLADRFDWSDARAALLRQARVAVIVARASDEELWKRVHATAWLDAGRAFVVGAEAIGATSIVADPAVPARRYRADRNVIAVAPSAVQSFAAGFIADQLKRTNGSSR
jgi:hypothetical protein